MRYSKEYWDSYVKELKEKLLGKKIVGVGYTHFAMYLKLEDGVIVVCGSSSGRGICIGSSRTWLEGFLQTKT